MTGSAPAALSPAGLTFDERGLPFDTRYADVYKSRFGAVDEAEHVFAAGSLIGERSAAGSLGTLLELGFGLGVNLFATWRARERFGWCRPLHYVGIDAHPPGLADARRAWETFGLEGPLRDALEAQWPLPTRGRHRLRLPAGIILTLILDDVERALSGLDCIVDAVYLDGFSPDRNPRMWSAPLMRSLARSCRPGRTTVATYSTAATVRESLSGAGFRVERVRGYGTKRHALRGRYAPDWTPRPAGSESAPLAADAPVAVVGGGLAGAMIAPAIAAGGRPVTWIGEPTAGAFGASGQPVLAAHPHLSPDDNPLSRLCRAALAAWRERDDPSSSTAGARAGAGPSSIEWRPRILAARGTAHAVELSALPRAAGLPEGFVRWLDPESASDVAGVAIPYGGLCLDRLPLLSARCGDPPEAGAVTWRRGRVARLDRSGRNWRLLGSRNELLAEGEAVVLATGDAGAGLVDGLPPVARIRGQSSVVVDPELAGLRAVIGADAYACPLAGGRILVGASYDARDLDAPDPLDDAGNLERLARLVPDVGRERRVVASAVGFRHVLPDRLPAIGPVLDADPVRADPMPWRRNDRLTLPRLPGLFTAGGFGSRGVLWSALAAALLADMFDGAPTLLARPLRDAVDPARFARRALRRGRAPD